MSLNRCTAVRRRTVTHTAVRGGHAPVHGHVHGRAWLRLLQHGHAAPVHGRMSLHVLLLALSGLRLTFILPLIPPESYLFHQNLKVLPKSTDKPQYEHN